MRFAEVIPLRTLSIEDRLKLFMQVCEAIQHAHQKGIIHRDIKPSNIIVSVQDGKAVPKVIVSANWIAVEVLGHVQLISPNGGETISSGSILPITWETQTHDCTEPETVLVEFSVDNGTNWQTVASVDNTGKYDWVTPSVMSDQCRVRVAVEANSADSDASDEAFTVFVCRAEYEFDFEWGNLGSDAGQLDQPYGIEIDGYGNVYVADHNNNRIQKFDAKGNLIGWWGGCDDLQHQAGWHGPDSTHNALGGSQEGQFDKPVDIAISASGVAYVTDHFNHRVQVFTTDGQFVSMWAGGLERPMGIDLDSSGNVYVCDHHNHRIQKYDSNGTPITMWGRYGYGDGEYIMSHPKDIVVNSAAQCVYVADSYNHRVKVFTLDGEYITQWGDEGTDKGQFQYLYGIDIDAAGNVYVADWGNNRIQKFGPEGRYITQWGNEGQGIGKFQNPNSIAINAAGQVYTTDTYNNRVQKFIPVSNPFRSDISGPNGIPDCRVDLSDFAVLAEEWLECGDSFGGCYQ